MIRTTKNEEISIPKSRGNAAFFVFFPHIYTFNKMCNKMLNVATPEKAAAKITEHRKEITKEPKNLMERVIRTSWDDFVLYVKFDGIYKNSL